jgi:hypothetical protein
VYGGFVTVAGSIGILLLLLLLLLSRSELAAVVQVLFRKRPNRNISACVGIDVEVPSHLPIFVDERNWRVRVHDRDQKDLLGSRDRAHAVVGRWCWLLPRIGDNFLSVQELMRGGFLGNIDGGSCGRVFAGSSLLTSSPAGSAIAPLLTGSSGFRITKNFLILKKIDLVAEAVKRFLQKKF